MIVAIIVKHTAGRSAGLAADIRDGSRERHSEAADMMMSVRLMTAVAAGERDPERLKVLALKAVAATAPPDDPAGGA